MKKRIEVHVNSDERIRRTLRYDDKRFTDEDKKGEVTPRADTLEVRFRMKKKPSDDPAVDLTVTNNKITWIDETGGVIDVLIGQNLSGVAAGLYVGEIRVQLANGRWLLAGKQFEVEVKSEI